MPQAPSGERGRLPAPPTGSADPATRSSRPGFVTAAAMILMVLGGFGILFGVDLIAYRHAEGIRDLGLGDALPVVAGAAMAAGALQVGAGVLILRLSHVGRVLGLSLATFFLLAGIATLPSQEATAGVGLVLNGLVVYALLAYRHVFRRRTSG